MTVGVIYFVLIFDLLSLDHKQWYLLKMNVSDIRNVKNKKIITIWFFCLIMPNLGELIFTLPVPTRHEIRKLEKVFLKLQKTELTCAFNESCLRENILPKYTQLKLHDVAATEEEFTNDFRRKLVERQLEENKTKLQELKEENLQQRRVVQNLVELDSVCENIF